MIRKNAAFFTRAAERVEKLDTLYKRGHPPLIISPPTSRVATRFVEVATDAHVLGCSI